MRPQGGPNPFLDATAGQMLAEIAAHIGAREAIIAADRRITYTEFLREARRFARGLLALDVRKDDEIALWLPNRPAWLFAQYACAMLGAVVVALNTRYKAHELAYILGQSEATTLLLTDHLGPVDYLETPARSCPRSATRCRESSTRKASRISGA
jgi:fatty-acyl-CoA synthase